VLYFVITHIVIINAWVTNGVALNLPQLSEMLLGFGIIIAATREELRYSLGTTLGLVQSS
jgi:hypothetical protein